MPFNPNQNVRWILGSRSPRRLELLQHIVPADSIEVLPPHDSDEAGFDGLHDRAGIEERLLEIARAKCDDVVAQLPTGDAEDSRVVVITADTVIIAADTQGRPVVLGKPPEDDAWPETVRRWFMDYYFGRTHTTATALCVAVNGQRAERIVETRVTFDEPGERWLDWYLSTDEPRGKAGGYAIQDAAGIFVSRVDGSLSNVIGLPLRELLEMLEQLGIG